MWIILFLSTSQTILRDDGPRSPAKHIAQPAKRKLAIKNSIYHPYVVNENIEEENSKISRREIPFTAFSSPNIFDQKFRPESSVCRNHGKIRAIVLSYTKRQWTVTGLEKTVTTTSSTGNYAFRLVLIETTHIQESVWINWKYSISLMFLAPSLPHHFQICRCVDGRSVTEISISEALFK